MYQRMRMKQLKNLGHCLVPLQTLMKSLRVVIQVVI